MRSYKIMLMLFAASAFYNFTIAQSNLELKDNRALLRNHSRNDIALIQLNSPNEFQLLKLYYTASFAVEILDCPNCELDEKEFYNLDLFNIQEFEHLRMAEDTYSFKFKDKYSVTLFSRAWLNTALNGYSIEELIRFKTPREFPAWNSTGNQEEDYQLYSQERDQWIRVFPNKYREFSNNGQFKVIRIAEWESMPPNKRDQLKNGSQHLLIID